MAVLIVSSDRTRCETLAALIRDLGLQPHFCGTSSSAVELLGRRTFSGVLCDDQLPDGTCRAVIGEATVPVVVVSHRDDWDSYLSAMKAGAFDYILFPFHRPEAERILESAMRESRLPLKTSQAAAAAAA